MILKNQKNNFFPPDFDSKEHSSDSFRIKSTLISENDQRDEPKKRERILCIQSAHLPYAHGFFGCEGGVSPAPFASLNGSTLKDPNGALENRGRALEVLGLPSDIPLIFPTQSHGTAVGLIRSQSDIHHNYPQTDALVSCHAGVAIGILTADCSPVILADPKAGIIAIAHAGWRGACHGILENTLDVMESLGAKMANICGFIGPTIRAFSYEVLPDFQSHLQTLGLMDTAQFFHIRWNKLFFDLPGYIQGRLKKRGCQVFDTVIDTFGTSFFSRRYALYCQEKNGHLHQEDPMPPVRHGLSMSIVAL